MGVTVSNIGGMQWVEDGVNVLGFTKSRASSCMHEEVVIGKFANSADRANANAVIAATASGQTAFETSMASVLASGPAAVWAGWSGGDKEECFAIANLYRVKGWSF